MKPERHETANKIFNIFQAALEIHEDRRAAFLDEQCKGDATLRKEVEALLYYDERAGGFIESPVYKEVPELIADDHVDSIAMEAVGPFRIIKRLGSGGMGDVYLAKDSRLGRHVALKLLDRNLIGDSHSRTASLEKHDSLLRSIIPTFVLFTRSVSRRVFYSLPCSMSRERLSKM
jgi:hypothetical protein